jgi:dolichyl-phosphate-mannose-protein mannosyltransferase
VEPVNPEDASYNATRQAKKGTAIAPRRNPPARERIIDQNLFALWIAAAVILVIVIAGWYYFLPLTYGYPGLTIEQVNARKWLGYDLHFAK